LWLQKENDMAAERPNPASAAGQKSSGLAFTGTPLGLLTAAGLALIAVGAALTRQRRRRS